MGSFGGGAKGGAGMSVPPPQAAPQIKYVEDSAGNDARVAAEADKAQKALLAMKGRSSTILTEDLGVPNVSKRVALGG